MKIQDFLAIPNFVNKYIDKKEPGLDNLSNDFCRLLKEIDYVKIKNCYKFIVEDNYTIKRFLDFFFTKSNLDYKYNCIYEDELDMPKSVTNEYFLVQLENESIISLFIKSYEDGILILEHV